MTARSSGSPCSANRAISSSRRASSQPGVVVTKEDVHRAGCGIQAPGKRAHRPTMVPYAGFGWTVKGGCMKFDVPWERTARPG